MHRSSIVCHLFADPFKTGQRIDSLDAVRGRQGLLHGRGDKGFNQRDPITSVFRNHSGFLERGNTVFCQQCADLITGQ